MAQPEKYSWLDSYIEEVFRALGTMDFGTLQPFGHLQFHPLYSKEWCGKLCDAIENSKGKRLSVEGESLTEIRCQLYFALLDAKCARLEKSKRLEIADFFNKLILSKAKADPYGSKSNIVHSKGEVQAMLNTQGWQDGTPQASRKIGALFSCALQYVHGLYADIYTDYGTENFGPYDVSSRYGKGAILVIRNFGDLKPLDLWNEATGSPIGSLKILTVYNSNVKFSCDLISCHSQYQGDLASSLLEFKVEADGKAISLKQAERLTTQLGLLAREQWRRLIGQEFEKTKQAGLMQRSYTMKRIFDQCGVGWKPGKQMRSAVEGKQYADEKYWGIPKEEKKQREYWRKMFDPREEFYPKGAK